jgi:uncharacterized protein
MDLERKLSINDVKKGKNSVLFNSGNDYVLYEKLANTIHSGAKSELEKVQALAESVEYKPMFESDSLKLRSSEKLDSLLLNVTESCNLACGYCIFSGNYEGERLLGKKHMSFDTAKKALDLAAPQFGETAYIGFYGGEPLNNFKLIQEIVGYTKRQYPEQNAIFSLTTNFVNADKYLDFIIENGICANISLDGPKEVHDKYRVTRHGEPTFDRIMFNLSLLEKVAPGYARTHFGLNGTFKDAEDLPRIIDYFIENGNDFIGTKVGGMEQKGLDHNIKTGSTLPSILHYASIYSGNILAGKTPSEVLSRLFEGSLKSVFERGSSQMPGTLKLSGSCYPGKRKLFVETDGGLYMCEKFGGRVSLGHVDTGVNQAYVDKAIEDFAMIRSSACADGCWAQRLCTPCIHAAKDVSGGLSPAGLEFTCGSSKKNVLIGVSMYASIVKQNPDVLSQYFAGKTAQ